MVGWFWMDQVIDPGWLDGGRSALKQVRVITGELF